MAGIDFSKNALSNLIAEHIAEQIMTGELKPGQKLIENDYAVEYGTSRAPVREAFYLLTIEGLVERIPRKGAIVKGYTEEEIYDLLEIRILLESLAMKRIIKHGIDLEMMEEMERILRDMHHVREVKKYTELNYSFHMCLIKMSKSNIIHNMYSRLANPLLRIQSLSFANEGNIEKSLAEHTMLVNLLKKGDVHEAAEILMKHNHDVIESIRKRLKKM
ncbi:GntR family transcriptional regulator [Geobacillus subterraneus]|uniref:GntR family transcriptional regulator n=1 Tax=Geobacillus subterraneus TaxID=129338 RepID=UPI00161B8999